MTDEEAMTLKPGDPVVGWLFGRVRRVDGVRARPPFQDNETPIVHVSRGAEPLTPLGIPGEYEPRRRGGNFRAEDVMRVREFDGNVFADWLRDNGYENAADALRAAFPMPLTVVSERARV